MNITYNWKITGLKKQNYENFNDVVVKLYWTKTGTNENGVSGSFRSSTNFDLDTINPAAFIPYENLTNEKALEWVQTLIYGQSEDYINREIFNNIIAQLYPSVDVKENQLPWNI